MELKKEFQLVARVNAKEDGLMIQVMSNAYNAIILGHYLLLNCLFSLFIGVLI